MNWTKIDKVTIFNGVDENGNRYLSQFLRDYSIIFKTDVNASCRKCLNEYYNNLIKHINKMGSTKNTSGYKLRLKYDGIPLKFGSAVLVTNSTITKEQGDYLLKNHVLGEKLFDEVPEASNENSEMIDLKKIKRTELDEKAKELSLDPSKYANKEEIFEAILGAEASNENSEEE